MTLEDLQEAGALLPEEEWGEHSLETTANRSGLILTGIVAVAATGAMYLGGGNAWTWAGGAVFILDLMAFTWLSLRAVDAQNRRRASRRASEAASEESDR